MHKPSVVFRLFNGRYVEEIDPVDVTSITLGPRIPTLEKKKAADLQIQDNSLSVTVRGAWPNFRRDLATILDTIISLQINGCNNNVFNALKVTSHHAGSAFRDLADLLNHLPRLQEFRYSKSNYHEDIQLEFTELPVLRHLKKLETTRGLSAIFKKARNLRGIFMRGFLDENLLRNNRKLEKLVIHIQDEDVGVLVGSYPNVLELYLETTKTFDENFKKVVEAFPNLRKLQIIMWGDVTVDLGGIVFSLKTLSDFTLGISAKFLWKVQTLPILTKIKVLDAGEDILEEIKEFMAGQWRLKCLSIYGDVGAITLKEIIKEVHGVEELHVVMRDDQLEVFKALN